MVVEADPRIGGFVPVARFDDPAEAAIAAGALRAQGFDAFHQPNFLASQEFILRRATGGSPVFVPTEDAEAARVLIKAANPANPDALDWRSHPQALSAMPLALLAVLDPITGYLIAGAKKHPTAWRVGVTIICVAILYGGLVFTFVMLNLFRQPY